MSFISRIVLALGLKSAIKALLNDLIDATIGEIAEELAESKMLNETEKKEIQDVMELLPVRLKALIEEKL